MWTLTNDPAQSNFSAQSKFKAQTSTRSARSSGRRKRTADDPADSAPVRLLDAHRSRRGQAGKSISGKRIGGRSISGKPIVLWHPASDASGSSVRGSDARGFEVRGFEARGFDVRGEAAAVVHGLGLELVDAPAVGANALTGNQEVVAHLVEANGVEAGGSCAVPAAVDGAELCYVGLDPGAVYAAAARNPGAHPIVLPSGAPLLSKIVWGSRHGSVLGHVIEIADGPGSRNSAAVVTGVAQAVRAHGWSVVVLDADACSDTRWGIDGGMRWPEVLAAIEDGPAASTLELLPRLAGVHLVTFAPGQGQGLDEAGLTRAIDAFSRAVDVVIVDRGPVAVDGWLRSESGGARRDRIVCLQRPWALGEGATGESALGADWSVLGVRPRGCDSRAEAAKIGAAWAGSIQGRSVISAARGLARKVWIPQMEAGRGIGEKSPARSRWVA